MLTQIAAATVAAAGLTSQAAFILSFTSSMLTSTLLADPRTLSFGFADVTAPATIINSTL